MERLDPKSVRGSGRGRPADAACRSTARWAWRHSGPTGTPSPITASSGISAPGSATTAAWRSRCSPTTSTRSELKQMTELVGHQHLADVVRRSHLLSSRIRTRTAAPTSGSIDTDTKQTRRSHPLHRLRHRLSGAGRRCNRLPAGRQALSTGFARRAAATKSPSASRTTVCAPAPMWPTSRAKSARPIRRSRWITRWRRTASERCSRRAAISSACRPKTARRAI